MIGNVNFLTVRAVSELWENSLNIPASIIERELRVALFKLEKNYPFHENVKVIPSEKELPPPDTIIDRKFIEKFCDKEGWKLPAFWFNDLPTGPSFPGRPSKMSAIVQELRKRAEEGNLAETLAEESRQLCEWARERFPGEQTPTDKTIANGIRSTYHILKKQPPEAFD